MIPPPPRSTLFPYTTLFRSLRNKVVAASLVGSATARPVTFEQDEYRVRFIGLPERAPDSLIDRKSTRLNSSHRTISYAVFCLKKKKAKSGGGARGRTTASIA